MAESRLKAYGLAAAVFLIDRWTKSFIEAHVSAFDVHTVIPGFFDISKSRRGLRPHE